MVYEIKTWNTNLYTIITCNCMLIFRVMWEEYFFRMTLFNPAYHKQICKVPFWYIMIRQYISRNKKKV